MEKCYLGIICISVCKTSVPCAADEAPIPGKSADAACADTDLGYVLS